VFNVSGTAVDLGSIDLETDASAAISVIDDAISAISTARGTLGAVQNRLEHTVANLGVAIENLTASESRISDVDMATEMVNFTRAQILSQAGTSMLAQANQAPQSILTLLRG
jgi:flagellin